MSPLTISESASANFINQIKDYAVFALDPHGIVTTWNQGAQRLKGYQEEEIMGHFFGKLFPDVYQQAGKPQEELELALKHGTYEAEDWRKRKDGSHFWASVTLTAIYAEDGQHIGFTKVTGDLTRQKELQEKLAARRKSLRHKNEELQRMNLDLDNFIYTVSHDLRSPIHNIEGLMKLLQLELRETNCFSKETEGVLQRVLASVDRFKRTIEDLTRVSRLQKDASTSLGEEVISVKEVYEDIMADLQNPSGRDRFFVKTDFQVYQVRFSRKNFRSILYNLLSNAIKYQSPERECIIELETRLEEPYVVLTVKDNGLGIGKASQEQLFTMFRRFHHHVEGTGIGLFMVKRIIENSGGKVEVTSEAGAGAEFRVYFLAPL